MAKKTPAAPVKDTRIDEALKRFELCNGAEKQFRIDAQDDLRFISGDQWDNQAKVERENSGQPCETFNRLPSFLRQITNEGRQNRPSIEVNPVGDGADIDTAQVIGGLIRHIEYDSNADTAYDNAAWYAAAIGEGFIRVTSEYEADDSFDQKLIIKTIPNPASVFIDPNSSEPDGSDADFAFIVDALSKDEFERKYPDSEYVTTGWELTSSSIDGWLTDSTVRIAEYYYKDWKKEVLYQVKNKLTETVFISKIKPDDEDTFDVMRERDVWVPYVKHLLINGIEILEETEWPGQHIPIIPVKGDEFWVEGKKFKSGLIRGAKGAQKSLNFFSNQQMQVVSLSALAPWIGAEGQFAGHEHEWRDANIVPYGFLTYNSKDSNGQPAGPPQRNSFEAPIQAISATLAQASDHMKAITGIYDPALGAQGNEVSGKAILARQAQTSTSNFHYFDNLKRSLKHLGRILVDVIPSYYDTPRMIRIVKPNNDQEIVAINQYDEKGKKHDLTTGKYDVIIKTGPSYSSRRQEAVVSMMELGAMKPDALPLFADLLTAEMDWPGAQLIAKRLRTQVPLQVLQASGELDDKDAEQRLPMLEQQVQQMQQQIQMDNQHLQALNAHAENIEKELRLEQEQNNILKQKNSVDLEKAKNDKDVKDRQMRLEEQKIELEYLIKEKELELAERQMKVEEAKMAITGVKAASEIEHGILDRATAHIEIMKPNINSGMGDDLNSTELE